MGRKEQRGSMTNQEETQSAIEWIEGLRDRWNDKDSVKYCNMAIKALTDKGYDQDYSDGYRDGVKDGINAME